jgi:hypothetical protein
MYKNKHLFFKTTNTLGQIHMHIKLLYINTHYFAFMMYYSMVYFIITTSVRNKPVYYLKKCRFQILRADLQPSTKSSHYWCVR